MIFRTVEYYHVDHLGSTRLKTNSTGGVIYESNYEPYGPEYGESGSEEFRYTGKHEDPTGLYYFGARYYDPVTGRFITRDSVFGDLSDPQSLNRYVYCRNNPHKYTDPDGKFWNIVIGAGIGGLLNTAVFMAQNWDKRGTEYFTKGSIKAFVTGAVTGAVVSTVGPLSAVSGVTKVGAIAMKVAANYGGAILGTCAGYLVDVKYGEDDITILKKDLSGALVGATISTATLGIDTLTGGMMAKGMTKVSKHIGQTIAPSIVLDRWSMTQNYGKDIFSEMVSFSLMNSAVNYFTRTLIQPYFNPTPTKWDNYEEQKSRY